MVKEGRYHTASFVEIKSYMEVKYISNEFLWLSGSGSCLTRSCY